MLKLVCKALLFDMDGTLIDSTLASERTWQRWATEHRVEMERIRAVHHGRRPEETIAIVAPHLNATEQARRIYAEQETLTEGIHPIAGATDLFGSMPAGQAAVVTAATLRIATMRLRLVGLSPPSVCVTAEMVSHGKPHPEGYLQAAMRLGFKPADCIVLEDAPAGLIAAHRAGMRAVAVLSNYTEVDLRNEVGPDMLPSTFIANFLGASFRDGVLRLPAQRHTH
jgi:sugar-phosphatase